ncbi:MAG: hypothetical protein V4576_00200 [Patescibacteria group bacterium]
MSFESSINNIGLEKEANYKGNWTVLLAERAQSSATKEKFLAMKEKFPTVEERTSDHKLGMLDKFSDIPTDTFEQGKDRYDANIGHVFGSTEYVHSKDTSFQADTLGLSAGYGDPGTVFKDAALNGNQVSSEHKTIIEAHEKAHGLFRDLTNGEKTYILSPFNEENLNLRHSAKADEVLARMSQLKNYFGFREGESFTAEHLEYAKTHYVHDVGLDNRMSDFFASIEDQHKFLEVINAIPC